MKLLLTIITLTIAHLTFGQTKSKEYIKVSFSLPWKSVQISLAKGVADIYTTSTDSTTVLIYQDLEPGYYKLTATSSNASEYRDSIQVKAGQKITVSVVLDSACRYEYPKNYIPACPGGHKEGILQIRYRNEKDGFGGRKYHRVTYTATGCLPRYYCTKHDIQF